MQASQLFHTLFEHSLTDIHKTRLKSLEASVESLMSGAMLTVSSLGRTMKGHVKVKHKIKRVDRLLNNRHLYHEKIIYYKAITTKMLGHLNHLLLIVDWSPFQHTKDFGLLRCCAVGEGRPITVYQEVMEYGKTQSICYQTKFLTSLRKIISSNKKVTIMSDTGFKSAWYSVCLSYGWDVIGRVAKSTKYSENEDIWESISTLYAKARSTPNVMKNIYLAKSQKVKGHIVLYKNHKKRAKTNYSRNPMERKYQEQAKRPWVLFTSLSSSAKKIVNMYKKRMQIEASFRDVKSNRFGSGLNLSLQKTSSIVRREILLLIAHITHCIFYLIGCLAERKQWHYSFQANTEKKVRVLSYVYLGRQVFLHYRHRLRIKEFKETILLLNFYCEKNIQLCGDQ